MVDLIDYQKPTIQDPASLMLVEDVKVHKGAIVLLEVLHAGINIDHKRSQREHLFFERLRFEIKVNDCLSHMLQVIIVMEVASAH